jgi:hypothetical protein
VPTVGVAAVAALEVIGRGEDEVGTFIVEVFCTEFVAAWLYFLFRGLFVEFDWLRHGSRLCDTAPFPFLLLSDLLCPLGVPPLPGDKPFGYCNLAVVMAAKFGQIKDLSLNFGK